MRHIVRIAAVAAMILIPAVGPFARAATLPTFTAPSRADDPAVSVTQDDPKYVNEPATAVGRDGARYVAYQVDSQLSVTHDGGKTWAHPGGIDMLTKNVSGCSPGSDVGDVDLATDAAGRVYMADLQITAGGSPDTGIQPVVARSSDGFATYQGTCSAHQLFSVDREWMATYTPPGAGAGATHIYMTYHDFGPNTMWVNVSKDGGQSWSQPVDAITTPSAVLNSACDTVPAGIATDPRNGWVYIAWTAGAGPLQNGATGCNYTQGTVFNNFYVAVSKDEGATWTSTLAFSGPGPTDPEPMDMSEIFGSIATDRAGNVHIAFPAYRDGEFGAYYASSSPAAADGTLKFSAPVKVSGGDVHTAYFTRLVAGDAGRVDLIYLGTPTKNVIATPQNKLTYAGAAGQPNCTPEVGDPGGKGLRFPGKPCELPPSTQWYLYLAQTLNGTAATPAFTTQKLVDEPVHTGDICTLGIFCLGDDNRDLADVNDIKIDATGGAQIAYTWESADGKRTEIHFQCQTGGPGLLAGVSVSSCLTPAAAAPATGTQGGTLPATGGPAAAGAGVVLLGGALLLRRLTRTRPAS